MNDVSTTAIVSPPQRKAFTMCKDKTTAQSESEYYNSYPYWMTPRASFLDMGGIAGTVVVACLAALIVGAASLLIFMHGPGSALA